MMTKVLHEDYSNFKLIDNLSIDRRSRNLKMNNNCKYNIHQKNVLTKIVLFKGEYQQMVKIIFFIK